MAVFCQFISLIIRRDSIDKYFPGGWNRFVLESPSMLATDEEIVSVSFMSQLDSSAYLDFLKGEGLQFRQSGDREIDDISELDQFMGHREERQWLEFGDRVFNEGSYFCSWKKGSLLSTIAMPTFAIPVLRNLTPEDFKERFSFVRSENSLDIYLDTKYENGKNFFLPQGMSIEKHFEYFSDWRKERENRRKKGVIGLKEDKDKNLIDKQKAQELVDQKKDQEREQTSKQRAKDRIHDNAPQTNRLKTQNSKRSKVWFVDDVEPEDFSDGIGKILKEYKENPLNALKKEKRQILDLLHKESEKQGYIFFGGYSHNYGISRIGDSYIYDVPAKKTGNLRKFRNQKIRVICVGSGTRFIRSYIAGPLI